MEQHRESSSLSYEKEILNSPVPVFVKFCSINELEDIKDTMVTVVGTIMAELKDKFKMLYIPIENTPSLASKFGITTTPTFMLFNKGRLCQQIAGNREEEELTAFIQNYLKS